MVDFAGWSMPVQYSSIVTEHLAARSAAAIFDVSHMGRLQFSGGFARQFLDYLLTRRCTDMKPGQIRYSLLTSENGGILDDVLVYCLRDPDGHEYFQLVVNASNRGKVWDWIHLHLQTTHGDWSAEQVRCTDVTEQTVMLAIQGPVAVEIVRALISTSLPTLKYYRSTQCKFVDSQLLVSRTGYTGEDGFEFIVDRNQAQLLWEVLLQGVGKQSAIAAGLGARDTLRLEAAMPLYGHELTEQITPLQAGLGFAVNLDNRDFLGADALRSKNPTAHPVRIGLQLDGKRVPRQHHPVEHDGRCVGEITSGTFSPTLQCPIAMAYVPRELSEPSTELEIVIRGKLTSANVVSLPFYRREG